MTTGSLRVLASPAPPVSTLDAVVDALGKIGTPMPAIVDLDMDCAVWNAVLTENARLALAAVAKSLHETALSSLLVFDLQVEDGINAAAAEQLGAMLGEALDAPAYVAARSVPASEWVAARPISLGVDGFALRAQALTQPRPGARGRGVALEVGAPTLLFKAALQGVPANALACICHATGDAHGGLQHIGAYPGISARSGEPFILLECSDPAKSPLARALAIIDIECGRYGGRLGQGSALSQLPLQSLLATLTQHMQLDAQSGQVIETHVGRPPAR